MSNICIFGDSIVQGVYGEYAPSWAEIIKMKFHETDETHVATSGISGEDSRGLLYRLEPTLWTMRACWSSGIGCVVIAMGTNDAREIMDESTGEFRMKVGISEFERNIRELVAVARGYSDSVVLVGLLHADETKTTMRSQGTGLMRRYRESTLRTYDETLRHAAESTGCLYVPLADIVAPSDLPDGLHPSAAAHERMAEKVYPLLADVAQRHDDEATEAIIIPIRQGRIRASAQVAMLGAITPNIRAITCGQKDNTILIRAIFDGPISEDDIERIGDIGGEIVADFVDTLLDVQCLRIDAPAGFKDQHLDVWVYYRYEG